MEDYTGPSSYSLVEREAMMTREQSRSMCAGDLCEIDVIKNILEYHHESVRIFPRQSASMVTTSRPPLTTMRLLKL